VIIQNLDNEAFSWFTRINSRLTLPYKVNGGRRALCIWTEQNSAGRNAMVNTALARIS
jgi:hypothetical protein